jgi:hypothetical protein
MTTRPLPPIRFDVQRVDVRHIMAQIRRRIRMRRARAQPQRVRRQEHR